MRSHVWIPAVVVLVILAVAAQSPTLSAATSGQPDSAAAKSDKRTISGRVTRTDGSPIKGATVECSFTDLIHTVYGTAKTDEDGRYAVKDVSVWRIEVIAQALGYAPALKYLPEGGDAEVDLQMQPGHWLEGRTVDERGKPVAGASVRMDDCLLSRKTKTDKNGWFRLADLAPKPIYIDVDHKDYCAVPRMAVTVDDRKDHRIVLRLARYVSGLVVDARSGKPVKTFVVSTDYGPDGTHVLFKTRDGRFRYRSQPGSPTGWFRGWDTDNVTSLTITVSAEGYLPETVKEAPVRPISAKSLVKVRLRPDKR